MLRYWDGAQWTDQTTPVALPPPPKVSKGFETAAWVTAVLVPIVGFVLGIVMTAKGESRGVGPMVLAVVMVAIFAGYL